MLRYYVKDGDVFELEVVKVPDQQGLFRVSNYQCLTAQVTLPRDDIHERYLIEDSGQAFHLQRDWINKQVKLLEARIQTYKTKITQSRQTQRRLSKDIF